MNTDKPDFVYSLHGIRTNAYWQPEIRNVLEADTTFKVGYRNYLRFDLFMFIFKNTFYYKPLSIIDHDLRDYNKDYRVSVIAHSFGTWLLMKALTDSRDIVIHHLILCGAIIPRASLWRKFYDSGQITGKIVNFCGRRDPFPALAELLSRDFGASGVVGAGDPIIEDSFHDLGHSGFLTAQFCRDHWIPILLGRARLGSIDPIRPRGYINALLWAAAHRGALLISGLLLLVLSYSVYQSKWSCAFRQCFVDVVRIHNYTSSTRQPGSPRRYVDQVTLAYKFNFDTDEYEFRAPADRMPRVVSFVGEQLNNIRPLEGAGVVQTRDGTMEREFWAFRIPVRDRRAYFSAEFANTSSEEPDAIEAFAKLAIRSFRAQIILPDGVSLVAPKGEFRKGIMIEGKPPMQFDETACDIDADGTALRCANLNLPANYTLFYCFVVKGWDAPGNINNVLATKSCRQIER